jgi:hypothetical protein
MPNFLPIKAPGILNSRFGFPVFGYQKIGRNLTEAIKPKTILSKEWSLVSGFHLPKTEN